MKRLKKMSAQPRFIWSAKPYITVNDYGLKSFPGSHELKYLQNARQLTPVERARHVRLDLSDEPSDLTLRFRIAPVQERQAGGNGVLFSVAHINTK